MSARPYTNDLPTEDGYYWMVSRRNQSPQIVRISMNFVFRRKQPEPWVFGGHWRDPLAHMLQYDDYQWSKIDQPEAPVFEDKP